MILPRLLFACVAALSLAIAARVSAQTLPDVGFDEGSRSHPFDLLHVDLDVTLDFEKESVDGVVRHTIRSLAPDLSLVQLDADDKIAIRSVTVDGREATWDHAEDKLSIVPDRAASYGDTLTVEIAYHVVEPERGIYFVRAEEFELGGRDQIWTQGEGEDHHYWIPIYDFPNDLTTTSVTVRTRPDWKVLSNGVLLGVDQGADSVTPSVWRYRMARPHAPYLIMIAAGDYLVATDRTTTGIGLEYWVYPDQRDRVEPTFNRTGEMIDYFENFLGVPYPWDSYAQVVVDDYMYGGMENTTATVLNDFVFVDARGFHDYNPDGLLAHEIAHQWFGDLVTNRSWAHLWLHESFATYLSALYERYRYGDDVFVGQMDEYARAAFAIDTSDERSPIASGNGVSGNLYGRGATILHGLHELLGDELFRRSLRHFLVKHAHSPVESNDLKIAIEEVTGYNLEWFFRQWIYGAGMPVLAVESDVDDEEVRLIVDQEQERDSLTGLFYARLPMEIWYREKRSGTISRKDTLLTISRESDTLDVRIPDDAEFLFASIDPTSVLLKHVTYKRDNEEILAQLRHSPHMLDRSKAVRELIDGKPDDDEKEALAAAYHAEPTAWIRALIVEHLPSLDADRARPIVLAALRDSNSDVREEGARQAFIFEDSVRVALLRPLLSDSSYDVVAAAFELLAPLKPAWLPAQLARYESVRNGRWGSFTSSWLTAVRLGKYNEFARRVAERAMPGNPGRIRSAALGAIADLDSTSDLTHRAIMEGITDESDWIFRASLEAAKKHMTEELRKELQALKSDTDEERWEKLKDIL